MITSMLVNMLYILQVSYVRLIPTFYLLDYCSIDDSTLHYRVIHEEASDDRADKCSISGYYHHRKRRLASCRMTPHKQCKYII